MRFLRSLVLPITMAGVVPYIILTHFGLGDYSNWPLQLTVGILLVLIGLAMLVSTIRLFATVGKGTLAPWDPPTCLVIQGPYRFVRNPMISGVVFILLGQASLFSSVYLLLWSLIFVIVNTLYFIRFEEPGLSARFGDEYGTYCRHVHRWLPRLTPWEP